MTRQLDPTILRFFTVSRIISPASETCLCKFHIKIEYFLTHRHHRARRRCLRFGSSPWTGKITSHPPTIIHFPPPSPTTPNAKFQKPAFHGLAYLRPHFLRFRENPKPIKKPSLSHTFLTPFCFVCFTTERWCPNPHLHYTFPLFPIFFFLFTYMSMFCPIF